MELFGVVIEAVSYFKARRIERKRWRWRQRCR